MKFGMLITCMRHHEIMISVSLGRVCVYPHCPTPPLGPPYLHGSVFSEADNSIYYFLIINC